MPKRPMTQKEWDEDFTKRLQEVLSKRFVTGCALAGLFLFVVMLWRGEQRAWCDFDYWFKPRLFASGQFGTNCDVLPSLKKPF